MREHDTADTTLEWYLLCQNNITRNETVGVELELEMRAPVITGQIVKSKTNAADYVDIGCTRFEIDRYEEYDLYYFKQGGYTSSSDIFRSKTRSPFIYERKTRIHRTHLFNDTVTLELSIEKDIDARSIMYPLTFINKVHIVKAILHLPSMSTLSSYIKCELIYRDGFNPTLEIEFIPSSYAEVINLYVNHIQTLPMWPPLSSNKPMQVSITELARKISSGLYTISPKADGEHAHMYLRLSLDINTNTHIRDSASFIIVSDSGSILHSYGTYTKVNDYNPNYIYGHTKLKSNTSLFILECEFVEIKLNPDDMLMKRETTANTYKIYIFDILKKYGPSPTLTPINLKMEINENDNNNSFNSNNNYNYLKRMKYINELVSTLNITYLYAKPIIHINSSDALEKLDVKDLQLEVHENDGFIITNIYTSREKFKLKTINTADLVYINNGFYTSSSDSKLLIDVSKIKSNSDIILEDNKIYEIDIDNHKIIRIRSDKHVPNAIMPTYCPPDSINVLKNSSSVPFARMCNNKYKYDLLRILFVHLSKQQYKYSLVDIGSGKLGDMNKWLTLKSNTSYIKLDNDNNNNNNSNCNKDCIVIKQEYGCNSIYAIDPALSKTRWYDAIQNAYNTKGNSSNNSNNMSSQKLKFNFNPDINDNNSPNKPITNTIHNKAPKLSNLHSINCIRKSADEFTKTYQYHLLHTNNNIYCLSIFFVPWSDSFIPLIYNAECTGIIIMDKAHQTVGKEDASSPYSVSVSDSVSGSVSGSVSMDKDDKQPLQKISINIPGSETALSIEEMKVSIEYIMYKLNTYVKDSTICFSYKKINRRIPTVIPSIEQQLIEMYTGYIIYKNIEN